MIGLFLNFLFWHLLTAADAEMSRFPRHKSFLSLYVMSKKKTLNLQ